MPSILLVAPAVALLCLTAVGCTRGEFEVTRADGTSARGHFMRIWTDTAVSASPEAGFSYSSNPDAQQQKQLLDALRGALLFRGLPAPALAPAQPSPRPEPYQYEPEPQAYSPTAPLKMHRAQEPEPVVRFQRAETPLTQASVAPKPACESQLCLKLKRIARKMAPL